MCELKEILSLVFLNEEMANGKHNPWRLAAIVVSSAGYVISLVFNGLSVVGVGK